MLLLTKSFQRAVLFHIGRRSVTVDSRQVVGSIERHVKRTSNAHWKISMTCVELCVLRNVCRCHTRSCYGDEHVTLPVSCCFLYSMITDVTKMHYIWNIAIRPEANSDICVHQWENNFRFEVHKDYLRDGGCSFGLGNIRNAMKGADVLSHQFKCMYKRNYAFLTALWRLGTLSVWITENVISLPYPFSLSRASLYPV